MGKKKAPTQEAKPNKGKLSSYRFSAECDDLVEAMAQEYGITKSAMIEAGIRLMRRVLAKGNSKDAITSIKESKKAN